MEQQQLYSISVKMDMLSGLSISIPPCIIVTNMLLVMVFGLLDRVPRHLVQQAIKCAFLWPCIAGYDGVPPDEARNTGM
jgi:hypothetical protein